MLLTSNFFFSENAFYQMMYIFHNLSYVTRMFANPFNLDRFNLLYCEEVIHMWPNTIYRMLFCLEIWGQGKAIQSQLSYLGSTLAHAVSFPNTVGTLYWLIVAYWYLFTWLCKGWKLSSEIENGLLKLCFFLSLVPFLNVARCLFFPMILEYVWERT